MGFWDADKHPRAAGGKFGSTGSSSSGGSGVGSAHASSRVKAPPHAGKGGKGKGKGAGGKKTPTGVLASGTGLGGRPDSRVKALQQALDRLGMRDAHGKPLALDGQFGPLTHSAVQTAQQRLGIPPTGRVTPALLKRLETLKTWPVRHGPPGSRAATRSAHRATHSEDPDMTHRTAEAAAPYGDVMYADPGYQADKKKRYPLDTEKHVRAAWSYINQAENAGQYSASDLKKVKDAIMSAGKKLGIDMQATEAFIGEDRTFSETTDLVRDAICDQVKATTGASYPYVCVVDLTANQVVYTTEDDDDLYQCSYAIDDAGSVELGDAAPVVRTYKPAPAPYDHPPEPGADGGMPMMADEAAHDRHAGRVVEAKGTDPDGGRVFRVRILAYGDSKNGRRYTEAVMRPAAALYEGRPAYDHHRTAEELQTSTLSGLVGYYRQVEAESDGLYGDLHLLPGATHAAEALDAALSGQDAGLPPVVGISHDVQAHFRTVVDAGRRLQEAVQIVSVDSADIVAKPSAGGRAVRAVAGGQDNTDPAVTGNQLEESDVPPTKADVLAAFKEATDEDLAAVGLARATSKTTESTTPPTRATESGQEPERVREGELDKTSFLAQLMIQRKAEAVGLPAAIVESLAAELPDRIVEADVDARIATLQAALGIIERNGLRPTVTTQVAQESMDKKVKALDAFFAGDFSKGYKSFREAFLDFTGKQPRAWDEDFNRVVLRESIGDGAYNSTGEASRSTESLSASSWSLVLGDSITRRTVAEYNQPNLQTWRQVVSSVVPINDFRTQRVDRVGGYGTLPAVAQGAPYQPLTSPSNEEVTYAISKRGGTEDVTLEMIANDDVRAIARIPVKLGLAAANTLYQFVWNFITTGAGTATNSGATIYDSTALFTGTSGHANYVNNGSGSALSQSALSAARLLMRSQTAYGDTAQFIAPTPKSLIVLNDIEELAWQLVTSAVALPTAANTPPSSSGAANTPNLHQGLNLIVLDYIANSTSTTAWWLAADPNMIPTIEVGFYQGRDTPELFTQSDPTVGSVFNADKVTYKIRHIYSGAVLDYRGLVKGNV